MKWTKETVSEKLKYNQKFKEIVVVYGCSSAVQTPALRGCICALTR